MEVIKMYPENLDARTQYKMMKSPEVKKMSDAEDSILQVVAWLLYNDADQKTGELREVLAITTVDGEMFGTISNTFKQEFADIVKFFGDDIGDIKVVSGESKAGRKYITCTVA